MTAVVVAIALVGLVGAVSLVTALNLLSRARRDSAVSRQFVGAAMRDQRSDHGGHDPVA